MADGVTVTVEVREAAALPVPGPPAAPGPLAQTGLALPLLLVLAGVLLAVGVALTRIRRTKASNGSQGDLDMMTRSRPIVVLLLTGVFALALTGLGQAQSQTTVTVSVGSGSRQLAVTDLAGQSLAAMALQPGTPSTFRVAVTDTDYLPTQGFSVQSTLTNLYRVTESGYDYTTSIPSSDVSVSYATNPLAVAGAAVDLNPDYLLSNLVTIDCAAVAGILGLDATQMLTDPLCGLLSTLTGSALTFTGVPLDGGPRVDIVLDSLDPSQLPLPIAAGGDTGAYTSPDCVNGIGAAAGCAGTGTARTYMTGTPPAGALNSALTTLLAGNALTGPLASADGTGAIASTSAVVGALQGSVTTAVADFGNTLTQYTGAQQLQLVNGLVQGALEEIQGIDLAKLTGQYQGFPRLTAAPGSVASGQYAGTLTVTLVE